ncbi:MAG: hypothetical protein KGL39_18900 [Patescibacteria group bacterium]|nr:hypothetical protein [Patescibacteria group bacterium]
MKWRIIKWWRRLLGLHKVECNNCREIRHAFCIDRTFGMCSYCMIEYIDGILAKQDESK